MFGGGYRVFVRVKVGVSTHPSSLDAHKPEKGGRGRACGVRLEVNSQDTGNVQSKMHRTLCIRTPFSPSFTTISVGVALVKESLPRGEPHKGLP